jgi:hypothetical protein
VRALRTPFTSPRCDTITTHRRLATLSQKLHPAVSARLHATDHDYRRSSIHIIVDISNLGRPPATPLARRRRIISARQPDSLVARSIIMLWVSRNYHQLAN